MAIDALAVDAEQLGRPLGEPVALSDPGLPPATRPQPPPRLAALATKDSANELEATGRPLIASHGWRPPRCSPGRRLPARRTPLSGT